MLPNVIEYLLTQQRPGGGWLVYRGGLQVVIPVFPPGATVNYAVTPLADVYAQLGWATRFGTDMVPNSFFASCQQYGSRVFSGIVSQRVIADSIDYFIMVTDSEPTLLSITNTSPLNQYCEVIGDFLVIGSDDDYAKVLEALARLGTSSKSEALAEEANRFLSARARPGAPPGGEVR